MCMDDEKDLINGAEATINAPNLLFFLLLLSVYLLHLYGCSACVCVLCTQLYPYERMYTTNAAYVVHFSKIKESKIIRIWQNKRAQMMKVNKTISFSNYAGVPFRCRLFLISVPKIYNEYGFSVARSFARSLARSLSIHLLVHLLRRRVPRQIAKWVKT